MGKRKKKNKDFQKVKLKVGRSLPKGDNVTDTSFKAKKIIVHQHLKSVDKNLEKTNLGNEKRINEVIAKLCHYSVSFRMDALKQLKEALSSNEDLACKHVSLLMEKIPLLMTDVDENIRKTVISVMTIIFERVPPLKLIPLSSVISALLCCAMSHINPCIQLDSLRFLDLILDHCPKLVTSSLKSLLPNFIHLISKQSNSKNGTQTSLLVDPSNQLMSSNSRKLILQRLNKFLKALVSPKLSIDDNDNVIVGGQINYASLIGDLSSSNLLPSFSIKDSRKEENQKRNKGSSYTIHKFATDVIPILFETWIEISSSNKLHLKNEIMDNDLVILETILEIFSHLMSTTEAFNEFPIDSMISKRFHELFFSNFPFNVIEKSNKRKRSRQNDSGLPKKSTCENKINLIICWIMVAISNENSSSDADKITQYLIQLFNSSRLFGTDQVKLTSAVIDKLIERKCKRINEILLALHELLVNSSESNAVYTEILGYFNRLFKYSIDEYTCVWQLVMNEIVNELSKANSNKKNLMLFIGIISNSFKQKPVETNEIISPFIPTLIRLACDLNEPLDKKSICNLLYWCRINEHLLETVVELKQLKKIPKDLLILLIRLLTLRYENRSMEISSEIYLQFLCIITS